MKSNPATLVILSTLATFAAAGCDNKLDLGDLPGDTEGGSGTMGDTGAMTSSADGTATTGDSAESSGTRPEGEVEGIDVLFVIDNSGSMGVAQRRLQDSAPAIVAGLEATGLDYRIGTTTTDNGNYWCAGAGVGAPHRGHLIPPASCRNRQGDFYFSGNDNEVFQEACAEQCALDELSLVPGADPWLSPETLDGTSMADALACSLPMGINGCGFEQPLEAMHLATTWSEAADTDESGFIRPNAHLVVIFVTDEIDCSLNPTHEESVVGEEGVGSQVFWSLPDEQTSPSSAVCWNAGVECTGSGTPKFDSCIAQDKATSGANTTDPAQAVIQPLSRYASRLDAVRASKVADAGVYTFGITGVSDPYAGPGTVLYATGANASDPDSFQARFGVGPGCAQGGIEAVPPVRLLELTQSGDQPGTPLFSICADNYAGFFGEMFTQIGG